MKSGELAKRWLHYTSAPGLVPEDHPDFPAWMELSVLAIDEPENAISLINQILEMNPTEAQKAELAAGPLEDVIINLKHPWNHKRRQDVVKLINLLGTLVWTGRMPHENREWFDSVLKSSSR